MSTVTSRMHGPWPLIWSGWTQAYNQYTWIGMWVTFVYVAPFALNSVEVHCEITEIEVQAAYAGFDIKEAQKERAREVLISALRSHPGSIPQLMARPFYV